IAADPQSGVDDGIGEGAVRAHGQGRRSEAVAAESGLNRSGHGRDKAAHDESGNGDATCSRAMKTFSKPPKAGAKTGAAWRWRRSWKPGARRRGRSAPIW